MIRESFRERGRECRPFRLLRERVGGGIVRDAMSMSTTHSAAKQIAVEEAT